MALAIVLEPRADSGSSSCISRRHRNSRFGATPLRRATAETDSPGAVRRPTSPPTGATVLLTLDDAQLLLRGPVAPSGDAGDHLDAGASLSEEETGHVGCWCMVQEGRCRYVAVRAPFIMVLNEYLASEAIWTL